MPNSLKKNYSYYYKLAGNSAREFLTNLNRIHDHVTRNISNANPPRFEIINKENSNLELQYFSDRNLCAVLLGLIYSVGDLFGKKMKLMENEFIIKNDDHCTSEVSFNE